MFKKILSILDLKYKKNFLSVTTLFTFKHNRNI